MFYNNVEFHSVQMNINTLSSKLNDAKQISVRRNTRLFHQSAQLPLLLIAERCPFKTR